MSPRGKPGTEDHEARWKPVFQEDSDLMTDAVTAPDAQGILDAYLSLERRRRKSQAPALIYPVGTARALLLCGLCFLFVLTCPSKIFSSSTLM